MVNFAGMFAQWDSIGVFTYVLPFLLIFAIIYSILSFTNVFKGNRGVSAVIALAVSLLALQFQIVSIFFSEIFPRMGVALSILLVIVILGGFFTDPSKDQKWMKWVLIGVTVVILIVVVGGSLGGIGFGGGFGGIGNLFYGIDWGSAIIILIVVGAIIAIISGGKGGQGRG